MLTEKMDIETVISILNRSPAEIIDVNGHPCKDLPFEFGRYKIGDVKDPVIIAKDLICMCVNDRVVTIYRTDEMVYISDLLVERINLGMGELIHYISKRAHFAKGLCLKYPFTYFPNPYGIDFRLKFDEDGKLKTVLEGNYTSEVYRIFSNLTMIHEAHFTPYLELDKSGNAELVLELKKVIFDKLEPRNF